MWIFITHLHIFVLRVILQDGEEEDNASIGTIYENVDNLVMQFDSTMQATVQAMGQVGQQLKSSKKHKKKERSLLRQTSFFKGSKSQKSKLSSKQKSELEKGESHSGYLYKRSASGSWKKKWCVLKGAVLSYSKLVILYYTCTLYMYMYNIYMYLYTCTCNVELYILTTTVLCTCTLYMYMHIVHVHDCVSFKNTWLMCTLYMPCTVDTKKIPVF